MIEALQRLLERAGLRRRAEVEQNMAKHDAAATAANRWREFTDFVIVPTLNRTHDFLLADGHSCAAHEMPSVRLFRRVTALGEIEVIDPKVEFRFRRGGLLLAQLVVTPYLASGNVYFTGVLGGKSIMAERVHVDDLGADEVGELVNRFIGMVLGVPVEPEHAAAEPVANEEVEDQKLGVR